MIIFIIFNPSLNPTHRQRILQQDAVKRSQNFVTVWVTVPSRSLASTLSRLTVESGLAACAQVSGPVESIYRWQGAVESAKEWRLVLKTRSVLLPKLEALVIAHHPYDTPQFLVLPILGGSAKYLAWMGESTESPARSSRKRTVEPR